MVGLHSCIAQSYGCTMFIWILHCMAALSLCSLCVALSLLGFRGDGFILSLIYPDHRLAAGSRGGAEWFHADVQASKGKGKGIISGEHKSEKRKREEYAYTKVTKPMRLKTQ